MADIEKLKRELIEQKQSKFLGNIYHVSQVVFVYNSNKIEGSGLTEEQTEMIFETNSFFSDKDDEVVRVDDIMETVNHFKLFDFILDHIDDELNKDMIIEMNKILKKGTSDESNPRYNVGEFKIHPNVIGLVNVIKTSKPGEVEKDIDMLISNYTKQSKITLEDIVEFHLRFERIHPFGDGNGRIGRAIMFKECLKNNIVPFIIFDRDKPYYLRGLKEYDRDKTYLLETCLNEQDIYIDLCKQLLNLEFNITVDDIE
ncbi:Fic family protein [Thomasclavelia cocleata]|jgi:Fic family protein|uniref:Fic family protein n=1 Tax=Thomasclavelia cocleata TaxID=69824 RepID=UPI00241ED1CF|nr:Fic family protein [Thomasclavelia cocleata]MCI9130626.1 Fic family protein [Thomasclavelia cocleata]MCI9630677.1 Fic family protein [Thomasclavelia cocleata]